MLKLRPRIKADPDLEISVDEAFQGVSRVCDVRGLGRISVRLPPGLRDGEVVRLEEAGTAAVRIALEPGRVIFGDDLRLTVAVDPRLPEDGGRLEVDTPYGPRVVWCPPGLARDGMLRVRDCGLPAREGRPQGHAFVRLDPDPALSHRYAREMLDRFTAAWTPHGRAAKAG